MGHKADQTAQHARAADSYVAAVSRDPQLDSGTFFQSRIRLLEQDIKDHGMCVKHPTDNRIRGYVLPKDDGIHVALEVDDVLQLGLITDAPFHVVLDQVHEQVKNVSAVKPKTRVHYQQRCRTCDEMRHWYIGDDKQFHTFLSAKCEAKAECEADMKQRLAVFFGESNMRRGIKRIYYVGAWVDFSSAGMLCGWNVLDPKRLHATIAYSSKWFPYAPEDSALVWPRAIKPTGLGVFGRTNVLLFNDDYIESRHRLFREAGAHWDYPEYQPHISLPPDSPFLRKDVELPRFIRLEVEYYRTWERD